VSSHRRSAFAFIWGVALALVLVRGSRNASHQETANVRPGPTEDLAQRTDHDGLPMDPGRYDIRAGAGGYSPIIGAVGGFAVMGIVLLFTVPLTAGYELPDVLSTPLSQAAGLMTLALVGCLLGAIGMAALAAERHLTVNLSMGAILFAIPAVIGVVSVTASFEVLAAALLPGSRIFLLLTTEGAAIVGLTLIAFAVSNGYLGRVDGTASDDWLRNRQQADRAGQALALGEPMSQGLSRGP